MNEVLLVIAAVWTGWTWISWFWRVFTYRGGAEAAGPPTTALLWTILLISLVKL